LALDRAAPAHWPRIEVVAQAVEEHGLERIVRVHAEAASACSGGAEASVLMRGREAVAVGDRLRLGIDVSQLHFFDPDSGDALA
jgi:ABC-type sugar transport system ATPase subunit